jgi:hypothetical protein
MRKEIPGEGIVFLQCLPIYFQGNITGSGKYPPVQRSITRKFSIKKPVTLKSGYKKTCLWEWKEWQKQHGRERY